MADMAAIETLMKEQVELQKQVLAELKGMREETKGGIDKLVEGGGRLAGPSKSTTAASKAADLAGDVALEYTVTPGTDIKSEPGTRIVFNAPYDDKKTYHIKVKNMSARRVAFIVKPNNVKRHNTDPVNGVLDPKEEILMAVSCDTFDYPNEKTNEDKLSFEYVSTPKDCSKEFDHEWFVRKNTVVYGKDLAVEYNW